MFIDLVEIILAYFQFVVLIVKTDIAMWPIQWQDTSVIAGVVNLDSDFFDSYLTLLNPDFRVYYLFVGILVPLTLMLLGLLAMNSKKIVLWYAVLLTGVLCLLVGAFATILASSSATTGLTFAEDLAAVLMIAGGSAIFVCLVAFIINRLCQGSGDGEVVRSVRGLKDEETADLHVPTLLQQILLLAVLLALGILLMFSDVQSGFEVFDSLATIIAIICFVFALLTLIAMVMGLFLSGRRALWALSHFAVDNAMRLLLTILSILYVAIASSTISIFDCSEYSCAQGERLADQQSMIPLDGYVSGGGVTVATSQPSYCDLCVIPQAPSAQICPVEFMESLCQPATANRLQQDKTVECTEMRSFFWPSAGIVALFFVLGTPIMFFTLVRRSTQILQDDFPIKNPTDDDQENWEAKVRSTKNVAKFLYQSYKHRFRYGRVFQTIHKVLIVGNGAYVLRFGSSADDPVLVSLIATLVVHGLAMLLLFATRPFLRLIEGVTAGTLIIFTVTLAIIGVLLATDVAFPGGDTLATVLLVLYLAAPVLFLVVGILLEALSAQHAATAKADQQKSKLGVVVESISTKKEIDETKSKILALKVDIAAEVAAQEKLEKNITVAAKDNLKKSRERQEDLSQQLDDNQLRLGQLEAYKQDLDVAIMDSRGGESPRGGRSVNFGDSSSLMWGTGGKEGGGGGENSLAEAEEGAPEDRGALGRQSGRPSARPTNPSSRAGVSPGSMSGSRRFTSSTKTRPSSLAPLNLQESQAADDASSPTIPSSKTRGGVSPAEGPNRGGFADFASSSIISSPGNRNLQEGGGGKSPAGFSLSKESPTRGGKAPTSRNNTRPYGNPLSKEGGQVTHPPPGKATIETSCAPSTPRTGGNNEGSEGFLPPKLECRQEEEEIGGMAVTTSDDEDGAGSFTLGDDDDDDEVEPQEQSTAVNVDPTMVSSPPSDPAPSGIQPALLSRQREGDFSTPLGSSGQKPVLPITTGTASESEQAAEVGAMGIDAMADSVSPRYNGGVGGGTFTNTSMSSSRLMMSGSQLMSPLGGGSPLTKKKDNAVFKEAARAVDELIKQEAEEQQDAMATVDHNINTALQRMLNRYFMVGGIAGFVALGFALLGLLTSTDADGLVIRSSHLSASTANHFAGFSNWTTMTQQCCCLPYTFDSPMTVAAVEKWVCTNGRVMERVRATRNQETAVAVDGYAVRALCSVSFRDPSICEAYADSSANVVLDCINSNNISSEERSLW